jgi:DNA repair ATPase RecN
MEIKIIIVAGLILFAMYVTNVFVTLMSSQHHLEKLETDIKEAIQKYLDMVPLLMLKLEQNISSIDKERYEWFDNWNKLEKHWPIWTKLHPQIQKIYTDSKKAEELVKELKQQEQAINELVHVYNEVLIKREEKLQKAAYKLANLKPEKYNKLTT